jgi:peptide/nickel transport system substrate-binding protein
VKRYRRASAALMRAAVVASILAACGSGSRHTSDSRTDAGVASGQRAGGSVDMVAGAYPGSLDPAADDTTQGAEVNWLVYTGLTTYRHGDGVVGEELQPGLATALPRVSDGGRTYTFALRRNLRFSNGATVRASDFSFAVERALRVPWPGSRRFLIPTVVGARAYAAGRSKSVSGIRTDDATGTIVIDLTAPEGAFDNVLAEPALGLIPAGSAPWHQDAQHPPPGDGPYEVRNIHPHQSYSVVKNPEWKPLPGIPAGHVNINIRVFVNLAADARAVLNNTVDISDWTDAVPARMLGTVRAEAPHRFEVLELGNATDYFFLNSRVAPFDKALAREAVVTGLDESAYDREGSGTLAPACFPLPPAVAGHPTVACPYGTPGTGDLARARTLLRRSGMEGRDVTVWSEAAQPQRSWAATFTRYLDQLGFAASLRLIADSQYLQTIGDRSVHPQAGVAGWSEGFPNPVDLYGALLDDHAHLPSDNENYGEVDDPHINAEVTKLRGLSTTQLLVDATAWQRLDDYTARRAYLAVFGYPKFTFFASSRMDYPALEMNLIYGWDFTSFRFR